MLAPSDHLLRAFASVPVDSRVLDLCCGTGRHTKPLVQLGFDLFACDADDASVDAARAHIAGMLPEAEVEKRVTVASPDALGYPDAFFDWVVAYRAFDDVHARASLLDRLVEVRRVMKDGGWVYLAVRAVPDDFNPAGEEAGYAGDSGLEITFTPETLREVMEEVGYAEAQQPVRAEEEGQPLLLAIYRRVSHDTPV